MQPGGFNDDRDPSTNPYGESSGADAQDSSSADRFPSNPDADRFSSGISSDDSTESRFPSQVNPQTSGPYAPPQTSAGLTGTGAARTNESPNGTAILVMGIVGFFICPVSLVAWIWGGMERKNYPHDQNVKIGWILGIVVTLLNLAAIAFVILMFAGIFSMAILSGQ
ncbi:MAG: hypothetical protein KDK30_04640 [Leptospiraceae bacterium]|nr:hypothetical protein [Leptospiraceae bacterium]MCB1316936.1 hypothetical protein [Leptospiraceae bacterium]